MKNFTKVCSILFVLIAGLTLQPLKVTGSLTGGGSKVRV